MSEKAIKKNRKKIRLTLHAPQAKTVFWQVISINGTLKSMA